ncbi:MAG: hypothetical protein SF339_00825 [Blastocatellia bacterium]|nr:hypothetical protein [Blastocatellia bacterium]
MADLALAEEKARARPEFARYLEVVQDIRNMLHNAPIPDLFDDDDDDDDDDDFFPFPPPTRRR